MAPVGWVVLLLSLPALVPGPSVAVVPLTMAVYLCPHCAARISMPAGARHCEAHAEKPFDPAPEAQYWSDGRREGGGGACVFRCPVCKRFAWVTEAKRPDHADDRLATGVEQPKAPRAGMPALTDWFDAIESADVKTPSREQYLRLAAWRAYNSEAQDQRGASDGELASRHRENLEHLLGIVTGKEPGERLLRAEILRELGKFAEASSELQAPVPGPQEGVRLFLQQRIRAVDSQPRYIPLPCQPTGTAAGRGCLALTATATPGAPPNSGVFELIDALLAQPRLTVEVVGQLSGRRLDREGETDVPRVFRSDTQPDRAVRSIEAREAPKLPEAFVIVELGNGGVTSLADTIDHFGKPDGMRPHAGGLTLTYKKGARKLSVGVGPHDELVQGFVLDSGD